jgi:hypothetical protein
MLRRSLQGSFRKEPGIPALITVTWPPMFCSIWLLWVVLAQNFNFLPYAKIIFCLYCGLAQVLSEASKNKKAGAAFLVAPARFSANVYFTSAGKRS